MQDGGQTGRDQRPRLRAGMDRSSACAALSPTQAEIDRAWGPRPKPVSLEVRRRRDRRSAPEPEVEEADDELSPGMERQVREAVRAHEGR